MTIESIASSPAPEAATSIEKCRVGVALRSFRENATPQIDWTQCPLAVKHFSSLVALQRRAASQA